MYFFNINIWNTSWAAIKLGGGASRYATSPSFLRIPNDSTNLKLSFLDLPNIITPQICDIVKKTGSLTSNSKGLLFQSA